MTDQELSNLRSKITRERLYADLKLMPPVEYQRLAMESHLKTWTLNDLKSVINGKPSDLVRSYGIRRVGTTTDKIIEAIYRGYQGQDVLFETRNSRHSILTRDTHNNYRYHLENYSFEYLKMKYRYKPPMIISSYELDRYLSSAKLQHYYIIKDLD